MNKSEFKYLLFYKPYDVLCQFSPEGKHRTLAEFIDLKNIYPVGRLDADSEGLLLITDDNRLKHRLTEPKFNSQKTYAVQVEGKPEENDLDKLRKGILLREFQTKPAKVNFFANEPNFPPREKPIRFRKSIPVSWIEITITEGKNRQIRRMTAAIGFPTLRLIRTKIKSLSIEGLNVGEYRFLSQPEVKSLFID